MRASSADTSRVATYTSRRTSRADKAEQHEMVKKMWSTMLALRSALPHSARVDQTSHVGRIEHVVYLVSAKQQALPLHGTSQQEHRLVLLRLVVQ